MKLRNIKKQVPAVCRKRMYESYKANMKFYGKPILTYKEWLILVLNKEFRRNE